MYIEKLSITNFRCFEKTELELNYPGRRSTKARAVPERLRNVNLFLGSNGSGKSSVFKALALGVLSPIINSLGFKSDYLVRRTKPSIGDNRSTDSNISVEIVLEEIDSTLYKNNRSTEISVSIKLLGDLEELYRDVNYPEDLQDLLLHNMTRNFSPSFFIAGYGANRRTERPEGYSETSRSPRYQRVASIFEDHVGLVPVALGYLNLQSMGYLDEAISILNSLLPEGVELTKEDSQIPLFRRHDVLLPFSALSDGFRTYIGWVWDLLLQLARVQSYNSPNDKSPSQSGALNAGVSITRPQDKPLREVSGVVIVDEIDLFLHPEWQRRVIEQIAEAFPKIQFCFSTHSPLVAGTLEPENIFVMETDSNGVAVVDQYKENIHGLTANQVLTSSYFGLSSTRAPGTEMDEITKLALSGKEADRLEFARRMAEAIPSE